MCNVYMFRDVREVLVKDVNTHPPPPWWSYDSMRNVYMFRNAREVLVKDVNTSPHPLMIIRQHVQHVKNAKKSFTPISESLIFEICNPSKGS